MSEKVFHRCYDVLIMVVLAAVAASVTMACLAMAGIEVSTPMSAFGVEVSTSNAVFAWLFLGAAPGGLVFLALSFLIKKGILPDRKMSSGYAMRLGFACLVITTWTPMITIGVAL